MSETSICNMALTSLGAPRILDTITEETEQARKCNAIFDDLRDQELSSFPWGFATEMVAPAKVSGTPLYDYTYIYQKPSDCLRIYRNQYPEHSFKVVGDKIYSGESPFRIEYIKQVTDTSMFSGEFINVLVARLKFELSYSFTNSSTLPMRLFDLYKDQRRMAWAVESQGRQTPGSVQDDRWVNARNGGTY